MCPAFAALAYKRSYPDLCAPHERPSHQYIVSLRVRAGPAACRLARRHAALAAKHDQNRWENPPPRTEKRPRVSFLGAHPGAALQAWGVLGYSSLYSPTPRMGLSSHWSTARM